MATGGSRLWFAWVRTFFVGVLAALPLACAEISVSRGQLVVAAANAQCPIGSEGCPCTAGGGCDPGLSCEAGVCVSYGEPVAGADYEFAEDLALEAPPPAPTRSRWREGRAERRNRRSLGAKNKRAASPMAEPAAAEMSAETGGASAPSPEAATHDPAAELDHSRQVIYTAVLHVSVFDLDEAADFAEGLPDKYGGWIESRYDYQITLRIAAEHLFEAMDELAELGVVLDKQLQAEDVTAEYVDLESRIRVLEQLVAHLEELLAQAKTVELALEIRRELDQARLELAAAQARMRQLKELVDYSTLVLIFSPRGPAEPFPTSNDPFPWVLDLGVELTEYR